MEATKDNLIFEDLKLKLGYMYENHPDIDIIAIFLQGSQNYGLDDEKSDIDAKAFCLPSLNDLIRGKKMISKIYIMPDGSHVEVKDIRLLKDLLLKQNPTYLELLATKYSIFHKGAGEELRKILNRYKDDIFTPNSRLIASIQGTFNQEIANTDKRRPGNEKEFEQFGIDVKALSHAYRLYFMLTGIKEGKQVDELYQISPSEKEILMDIKRGKKFEKYYDNEDKLIDEFNKTSQSLKKFLYPPNVQLYDIFQEKIYKLIKAYL